MFSSHVNIVEDGDVERKVLLPLHGVREVQLGKEVLWEEGGGSDSCHLADEEGHRPGHTEPDLEGTSLPLCNPPLG